MTGMVLYGYFRSSAAWRVRIAMNLKQLKPELDIRHLQKNEQRAEDYLELNPEGLVPALKLENGPVLSQSLAIVEYLDETYPDPPLLPQDALPRARVRSLALAVACDIHPLNNLRVLLYLEHELGVSNGQRSDWYTHWVHEGFRSAETTAAAHDGPFVFGESVTFADACLIPQIYNARRFAVPLDDFPRLVAVHAHCRGLPAFQAAAPESQPDAG
jgi:maleylacetoacetate isomerase